MRGTPHEGEALFLALKKGGHMARDVDGPATLGPLFYIREPMNSTNNPHGLEAASFPEPPERKEAWPPPSSTV